MSSNNRQLKRKTNEANARSTLASRSNTTSPSLLADNNSMRKKAKLDNSFYNPETLQTKRQLNQLKSQNEKMGNEVLEVEQLKQKVVDDLESNESRLAQALQKVHDLQATVQNIEHRHANELQRIKDKFHLKNKELIFQNEQQKEALSKHRLKLNEFELSKAKKIQVLESAKHRNKTLSVTEEEVLASYLEVDGSLDSKREEKQNKQIAIKSAQEHLKKLAENMKDKKQYMKDMQENLLTNEQLRRKQHDRLQELKGNIRVFCRVRPPSLTESNIFNVRYFGDDNESMELGEQVKSSLGKVTQKTYTYTFDRVFSPSSTQQECFEEISQLVQSALDGFNVCIFAYGQTGSGKTFTMQGPTAANDDTSGMIPRAVHQIYDVAQQLKQFGWEYNMEGQFLEIYNESIHDLLGDTLNYGKIKHDIHHDKNGRTTVTEMTTVVLDSPSKVKAMLKKANQNRATGATNMNERSSRSHSVFTLKLSGHNRLTDERTLGILNLIDLAGSERVAMSGATGDQLTETININKSLSCLKSVIHALVNKKEGGHIPYRNSKLTYLLQNSLGGNCKTLMFVNVSPLLEHFNESICSLRFATEVNSCHVGTAKKIIN